LTVFRCAPLLESLESPGTLSTKLLVELGAACSKYQDITLRNLSCQRIQVDEIWAFCYCKQKQVTPEMEGQFVGDAWTWAAIDADTKLVPCWIRWKAQS